MGLHILTNPYITIGGDVYTGDFKLVTIEVSVDLEPSTFFQAEWITYVGYTKSWVATFDYIQDFDVAAFDDTIWALLGVVTPVVVRPNFAVASGNNPQYAGDAILEQYSPLDTAVGEIVDGFITMRGSGPLLRTKV